MLFRVEGIYPRFGRQLFVWSQSSKWLSFLHNFHRLFPLEQPLERMPVGVNLVNRDRLHELILPAFPRFRKAQPRFTSASAGFAASLTTVKGTTFCGG